MLIRGGTVWGEDGGRRADVRVEGERIAAVGDLAPRDGEAVLDAAGLQVLPGMIDVHVHADDRIGPYELADGWPTASEIALRNGITTLASFVTQRPGETLADAVERSLARVRGRAHGDVAFHLTPTAWPWDWAEVERLVAAGFSTFKLYTTYREAGLYTGDGRLGAVMARLRPLGARLLVHCEDDATLVRLEAEGADFRDPRAHAALRPEHAETLAVVRVLELAERTGCPTHVVHVSSPESLARIAAARGEADVTCETAPHYLVLTDGALAGENGHRFLCTPPLRSEAARARLEDAAAAGAFELFATDHCAFTRADKDRVRGDLRLVPKGVAGLGALVPLVHEVLARRGRPLSELARRLAANPARLLGVHPRKGTIAPGADADLVVLDTAGPQRAVVSTLADAYETYPGRTTRLDVRTVLLRGRVVVEDNRLVTPAEPTGRPLAAASQR